MGCCSSKLVAAKTGSLRKRINSFALLEQILVAKNAGEQSISVVKIDGQKVRDDDRAVTVETVNTWELMAGLDEEQEVEATHSPRRLQSFDCIVKESKEEVMKGSLIRSRSCMTEEEHEKLIAGEDGREGSLGADQKGLRRKTMAQQLSKLVLPSETACHAEFPGLVSLPASSPEVAGEYDTPKFGRYMRTTAAGAAVFYPVLVAAMEEEMEEITAEEELVVQEMVAVLGADADAGEGAEVGGKEDDEGERVNGLESQMETHLPDKEVNEIAIY